MKKLFLLISLFIFAYCSLEAMDIDPCSPSDLAKGRDNLTIIQLIDTFNPHYKPHTEFYEQIIEIMRAIKKIPDPTFNNELKARTLHHSFGNASPSTEKISSREARNRMTDYWDLFTFLERYNFKPESTYFKMVLKDFKKINNRNNIGRLTKIKKFYKQTEPKKIEDRLKKGK